jgi:hypothetical protein
MALLARTVDYTDKDFDALRARLVSLVRSTFPEWTDFGVAGFGNLLLELYAFVGDVLLYYQDNQARESRISTATQRKNLLALVKLLGYRPSGARAASADVVLSLREPPQAPVRIPAGTRIRTEAVQDPRVFQLLHDVVVPAGATPPSAAGVAEHSETHDEVFVASGLPDQEIALAATPYLDGSLVVLAGNGLYDEVASLLSSTANDRHVTVRVDQNDRAFVRFGSGRNGALPTGTILVRYKTGGGAAGNVEAGALRRIEGRFTDDAGRSVEVSVTNPAPAAGGADRESMAQIRALAPLSIRAPNRSIAREDFEIHARQLRGLVARALLLTSNEAPGVPENHGLLFIVPEGGGPASAAIKEAVRRQVTEVFPPPLTFQIAVQDPVYLAIDVRATIYVRAGASPAVVAAAIRRALAESFAISKPDTTPNPTVDFGFYLRAASGQPVGELALSDLFNVVRDVPGVRKIGDRPEDFLLNGAHADVPIGTAAFPVLGAVTLVRGETGELL